MTAIGERSAAITGIGSSAIGRRLGRDPLALTVDACLGAIGDAGLRPCDIDGGASYPGGSTLGPPGYVGPGVSDVQDALGLELDWSASGIEAAGPLGPVFNACAAVATGFATHVLCFCTVWEATARAMQTGKHRKPFLGAGAGSRSDPTSMGRVGGALQWTAPFRAYSPATWLALYASRHFHDYGTTRQQLAQVALVGRANATKNPAAVYRDPLTLEDYLAAPMIATPLCLFDCDVPADGAIAVIVSNADAARDTRKPPLRFETIGCALRGRPSWDQFDDLGAAAGRDASAMLWERTDLRPSDVDVAQIYDGFSILTLAWLESLGFCGRGESGRFVEGGSRIALDGELPINTGGGQLSAGRLNGYGLLHEACVQLWREGGERQVSGDPEVSLVAVGGGPHEGCALLTRR